MRVKSLALRILNQLRHDSRTIGLMLLAPILLITLVYFILQDSTPVLNIAVVNAPAELENQLEESNISTMRCSESDARVALEQGSVIAVVQVVNNKYYIDIDGSDPTKANKILNVLQQSGYASQSIRADLKAEIRYIYEQADLPVFDNFGATLIGFTIFFFLFLVSGISFLQERNSGTLEKMLSTPICRWEIVVGYLLGFGFFAIVQSAFFSWYCVYILKVMMIGSFGLIILIIMLTAITALTLGMLMSTLANNEFQMMQFIPLVIVPQIFFSGLFDLPSAIDKVGYIAPLRYVAHALREVMIKGGTFTDIAFDLSAMLLYSFLFIELNTQLLKKYRRI